MFSNNMSVFFKCCFRKKCFNKKYYKVNFSKISTVCHCLRSVNYIFIILKKLKSVSIDFVNNFLLLINHIDIIV